MQGDQVQRWLHLRVDALVHATAQLHDCVPHPLQLPLTLCGSAGVVPGLAVSFVTVVQPGHHLQDVGLAAGLPHVLPVIHNDRHGQQPCALVILAAAQPRRHGLTGRGPEQAQGAQQRLLPAHLTVLQHIGDARAALVFGDDAVAGVHQPPHLQRVLPLSSGAHVHVKLAAGYCCCGWPQLGFRWLGGTCHNAEQLRPARPEAHDHGGLPLRRVDAREHQVVAL
ncbi:hypothetical protein V8C86DRAFT_2738132 [Haematococcus lacustris]